MHPFLLLGAFLLAALPLGAVVHEDLVMDGKVIGKYAQPKPGEICSLCYAPLHADDLVYQVFGQRVGVHAGSEDDDLRANPKKWLAHLRPHGAFLGTEAATEVPQRALADGWFFFGLYILLGLVFAALCAHRAFHAGYSPSRWFAAGLVFNAFGYAALLTRPKRQVEALAGVPSGLRKISLTYEPEPCPACGATNHPSAWQCVECGGALKPIIVSEVARAR